MVVDMQQLAPAMRTQPEASLRERKKLATRKAIHQAAFDLVSAHGFSGITVEAISDRAGVAPRTFWSYFSSKEDAVIDHDPERAGALADALLSRPQDEDPLTALRNVLVDDLSQKWPDAEIAHRRYELIRSNPQLMAAAAATYDEIERQLVSALAERLGCDPEADLFPGVMVSTAWGAFRIAHRRWGDPAESRGLLELLDDAFDQLKRGLAPLSTGKAAR
jgi:AcrR family transcriptional regulator